MNKPEIVQRLRDMVTQLADMPESLWCDDVFPTIRVTICHKDTGAMHTLTVGVEEGGEDE